MASNTDRSMQKKAASWAIKVAIVTFFIAGIMGVLAQFAIEGIAIWWALLILLIIIMIGISADVVGIAVASAEKPPFLSMAARKVPGAEQSLWLLQNAERVSNFCNDVIGDICGILSGATGASIVVIIVMIGLPELWVGIVMSALVASLTVGGKAFGKSYAMNSSREIVFAVGKAMHILGIKHKRR